MALQWKDIDFKNKMVSIDKTLVELQSGELIIQPTKTDSSNRTIKADDRTLLILKEWKKLHHPAKVRPGYQKRSF